MEQSAILKEIEIKEKELNLNKPTICGGVPLWRIFRFDVRLNYINTLVDYKVLTSKTGTSTKKKPRLISGFWRFLGSKNTTIIFPFARLANNHGELFDKFTDPIIDICKFPENKYIIVDPSNYVGNYRRTHRNRVVSNESRTISRQIVRKLLCAFFSVFTPRKVLALFNLAKEPFCLSEDYLKEMSRRLSFFLGDYYYFLFWFKLLRPRRVLIVYREAYFPIIAACKKLSIPIAEFQHGITLDKTVSYTGDYDSRIDPDYFFVFGDFWKDSPFEITKERIIPIGWAYKKYIEKYIDDTEKQSNETVLVISSAEISEQILDAVAYLSEIVPSVSFHIRLHPCEGYDERLLQKLAVIKNAQIVSNKEDSAIVLPRYCRVIGENSSVLYEALANGCKVGMLRICGLQAPVDIKGIKESFDIIETKESFIHFMSNEKSNHKLAFYSEFNEDHFRNFIEKKM